MPMKFLRLLYVALLFLIAVAMFAMPLVYVAIRLHYDIH